MEDGILADQGKVYLVDDDAAVRASLAFLLETAGFAVQCHATAQALLDAGPPDGPGCVITDVRLPDIDGLELQRRLVASDFPLPVIVITGHSDVPMAVRALKAGAVDFLEKPFPDNALLDAVHRAVAASAEAHARAVVTRDAAAHLSRLTARERDVLEALVTGLANKEIARRLGVSPRTVEVHRARVMEKMAVSSLAELVHMALAGGAIPRPNEASQT